ncbi:hypothetical protein KFK14_17950 [Sphingobium phenoxybenzoativorans]|uniref:FAD-binding PCMH-type domain-containing protein n=1 Tax=Sphingobium phenoxybenzoativorans TaxID=1592790 RepID=A0A975K4X1_9SPHN|nr:hypothetical protein [Sphingobium phenoxybenzoativorans]QUT04889.1 hypothetical protein KFK14_17950 [Sphingobium phenoxybenzoativorans]
MRAVITGKWRQRAHASAFCAALLLCAASPARAQASAGAQITNVASLHFSVDGENASISSNLVATRVGEILDVRLQALGTGTVEVSTGEADRGIPFLLTNSGNGSEAFVLSATAGGAALPAGTLFIDADRNGEFDPAIDTAIGAGGATPEIGPGVTLQLLVIIPASNQAGAGVISLHAQSATGAGAPGTTFAGRGDNGTDAVVGSTSAAAAAETPFTATEADASVVKSQQVVAPDGTSSPVSGATITYRLEVVTRSSARLTAAQLADPIPAGTTYLPGSLKIDGASLSDAADADNGRFEGSSILVALGDIDQPTTRVVTFQVKIQ